MILANSALRYNDKFQSPVVVATAVVVGATVLAGSAAVVTGAAVAVVSAVPTNLHEEALPLNFVAVHDVSKWLHQRLV